MEFVFGFEAVSFKLADIRVRKKGALGNILFLVPEWVY